MKEKMIKRITLVGLMFAVPQLAFAGTYNAPNTTISIDGDLSDWDGPGHDVLSHSFQSTGSSAPVSIDIKYAWDSTHLYHLVQETAPDDDIVEGTDANDWFALTGSAFPWATDSVGFYDYPGNSVCCDTQTGPATQYWIGLASTDVGNPNQVRHSTRGSNSGGDLLLVGDAANNLSGGLRAIEFRMSWDELRYTTASGSAVPGHSREDVGVGYTFRLDPLLVDGIGDGSAFNGQAYPGGSAGPADVTAEDTSYVNLIPEPSTLVLVVLGILGFASCARRRRR